MTFLYDYLPPLIELVVDIDFHGAHEGARSTQRRGKGEISKCFHIEAWGKYRTNRARDGVVVAVTAAAPIHWTCVHACTTANTFQGVSEIRTGEACCPAVVHQYYVHLLTRSWAPEVT